jgi:quercetin dioxygenase-like cupin family protein
MTELSANEPVARLAGLRGEGPLWGIGSEDLNATLLAWPPGGGTPRHVNAERDVLIVVLAGSGTVEIDGEAHSLETDAVALVPKGKERSIQAGGDGIRYLSVHLRRRLEIGGLRAHESPDAEREPDGGRRERIAEETSPEGRAFPAEEREDRV